MKTNTTTTLILSILLATLLVGCDSKPETTSPSTKDSQQKSQGVIPEHQLQALQKAKDAQKAIQDAKAAQEKALKEQGIN